MVDVVEEYPLVLQDGDCGVVFVVAEDQAAPVAGRRGIGPV